MRVLHLPRNIASQISTIVRALRDIGVEARGLVRNNQPIWSGDGVEDVAIVSRLRQPLRGVFQTLAVWHRIRAAIQWADVVHWHFNTQILPASLDLCYIASLGKVRLVEFWGSDIRIPDIAARDNPYLARLLAGPANRYRISLGRSRATQARFARYGFACIVPGAELMAYVQCDLFPAPFRSQAVLPLAEFVPNYPDPARRRPLVVHVPSDPSIKGTPYVLRAVEELRHQYAFDFRLIQGVPHAEAMALLRDCDIMLDQFIIGSFGTAALEAMAFGKPAVCYIKPSLLLQLPSDFPIVNANPDNLAQVVGELLADGQRRPEIGHQSRAYIEKYHDAHEVARQLVGIYQQLLEKGRRR